MKRNLDWGKAERRRVRWVTNWGEVRKERMTEVSNWRMAWASGEESNCRSSTSEEALEETGGRGKADRRGGKAEGRGGGDGVGVERRWEATYL